MPFVNPEDFVSESAAVFVPSAMHIWLRAASAKAASTAKAVRDVVWAKRLSAESPIAWWRNWGRAGLWGLLVGLNSGQSVLVGLAILIRRGDWSRLNAVIWGRGFLVLGLSVLRCGRRGKRLG